jgi:teichuronic acid exporter
VKKTTESQIKTWLSLTVAAKATTQVISWSATLYAMRLLEPNDYGVAASAFVYITAVSVFLEYTIIYQIVRKTAQQITETKRAYEGFAITAAGLASLALAAIATLYYYLQPDRRIAIGLWIAVGYAIIAPARISSEAELLRTLNFKAQFRATILAAIISSISTALMVTLKLGYISLILGPLINLIALTYFYRRATNTSLNPKFSLRKITTLYKRSTPIFGAEILQQAATISPILIWSIFLSTEEVGLMNVALYWAFMPLSRTMNIINAVTVPALAKKIKDKDNDFTDPVHTTIDLLSWLLCPLYCVLIFFSREIISLALGEKWLPAAPLFAIACISMPLRGIRAYITGPLQARAHDQLTLNINLITASSLILASLFSINFGAQQSIYAYSAASAVASLIGVTLAARLLTLNLARIGRNFLLSLVTSTAAALITAFVATNLTPSSQHRAIASELILLISLIAISKYLFERKTTAIVFQALRFKIR